MIDSKEVQEVQELGTSIVELMMLSKAPPKRAIIAMLSVMLPTLHQAGFDKEHALGMIGEYWDNLVEQSFKPYEQERRNVN